MTNNKNVNEQNKKYFEDNTFNQLIKKIGYDRVWNDIKNKNARIYLYGGNKVNQNINLSIKKN